ncbi:MAG: DUF5719 family protein [Acidimicrobiia bacterium]
MHRTPILVLVGALVVLAIVYRNNDAAAPAPRTEQATLDDPGLPSPDALSASWFCAEGTSTPDGRAAETVIVTSVADVEISATVTVMPGGDVAPVSRTLRVAPHREVRLAVADVLATPEPGVVVEVVGGQAAVAHELRTADDIATEPCARRASPEWYFASGTTVRGTQQYLVLFNPFGDDAIVDVTVLTDTGVQAPDQLQGLGVQRRSRVSIPIHDLVPRQDLVALEVHARTGRVVAERSMIFDGTVPENGPARRGISLSLGAISPRRTWDLPYGSTIDGGTTRLGVANFGSISSNVEVDVLIGDDQTLTPLAVSVPARGVVSMDVGDRVPAGSHFAVRAYARTSEGTSPPLVVEMLSWSPEASASTSVATTLGSTQPARRWVVPLPDVDADVTISVINAGSAPATAEVRVYGVNGAAPSSAPAAAIDAGKFATFSLGELGLGGARTVFVTSDGDVVVGLGLLGNAGGSSMAAVPDFGYGRT